jgi:YVTN family beta-propeller protein
VRVRVAGTLAILAVVLTAWSPMSAVGSGPLTMAPAVFAADAASQGAPAADQSPSPDVSTSPEASVQPDPSIAPDPTASPASSPPAQSDPSLTPSPDHSASPAPTPAATPAPPPAPPSDRLRLRRLAVIRGSISPKSVVSTQTGLVFAQNMMYRHTMTIYNRSGRLVRTLSDRVLLSAFGFRAWTSPVRGAPVEAAVAPDGRHIYVSQYSMYGPGFSHPGWDIGWVNDRIDRSFVYEISTVTLRITRVIRVGPVPKAVGVSPDGRWLLVGNWTHCDVSLVDLRTGREVRRIVVGGNPRGIAFTADSRSVYLSAESGQRIMRYDFATGRLTTVIARLPGQPRHLVIDPTGRYLYASLDQGGQVVKISIALRRVVDRVATGSHPRTIVLAPDGRSLYVVNYESRTLTKVRTSDMVVIQRLVTVGTHPVGVTYDIATRTVWVSCYTGTIERFADR